MINKFIYKVKKNPYQFFFFKFLILFLFIFILDYTIGTTLYHFYFKQTSGIEFRTTYALEKTEADVLIFGSSRANHHYYPNLFEDRLKLKYYNVGSDGYFLFYNYAFLRGILKRYTPKIIVLDFLEKEFHPSGLSYYQLSALLPYYKTHPEIRSIVELKSPFEKVKLLSHIYPFNSSIFTIGVGNMEFNKKRRNDDIKGYVPLTKIWDEPIQSFDDTLAYIVDEKKVECYENFIKDCKTKGVKLFIFVSPYFMKPIHPHYSITLAEKIAHKYDVGFYDYSNDTTFTSHRTLFADTYHLNDTGARIYTNKVIDRILSENIKYCQMAKIKN